MINEAITCWFMDNTDIPIIIYLGYDKPWKQNIKCALLVDFKIFMPSKYDDFYPIKYFS